MLVSHLHKFIYFKNIKVASSSIECFFTPYCLPRNKAKLFDYTLEKSKVGIYEEGIIGDVSPNPKKKSFYRHVNAIRTKKIVDEINPNIWETYFKFCAVRNPWDKMVSYYFYYKNYISKTPNNFDKGRKINNFEEFIELIFMKYFKNDKKPCGFKYYTIQNKFICNFHIKYENLVEDIKTVCKECNIENYNIDKLPNINGKFRDTEEHYSKYYNNYTKELVGKMFELKINKFNYNFDKV